MLTFQVSFHSLILLVRLKDKHHLKLTRATVVVLQSAPLYSGEASTQLGLADCDWSLATVPISKSMTSSLKPIPGESSLVSKYSLLAKISHLLLGVNALLQQSLTAITITKKKSSSNLNFSNFPRILCDLYVTCLYYSTFFR